MVASGKIVPMSVPKKGWNASHGLMRSSRGEKMVENNPFPASSTAAGSLAVSSLLKASALSQEGEMLLEKCL